MLFLACHYSFLPSPPLLSLLDISLTSNVLSSRNLVSYSLICLVRNPERKPLGSSLSCCAFNFVFHTALPLKPWWIALHSCRLSLLESKRACCVISWPGWSPAGHRIRPMGYGLYDMVNEFKDADPFRSRLRYWFRTNKNIQIPDNWTIIFPLVIRGWFLFQLNIPSM